MRNIHEKASKGNKRCKLAINMLEFRLAGYIGSYMAKLPEVDAIIFTAGIGQGAHYLRKDVCKRLENLGVKIDLKKNESNKHFDVTAKGSKVKIFVIETNEEWMIAKETEKTLKK
jgi:acetate kinase